MNNDLDSCVVPHSQPQSCKIRNRVGVSETEVWVQLKVGSCNSYSSGAALTSTKRM